MNEICLLFLGSIAFLFVFSTFMWFGGKLKRERQIFKQQTIEINKKNKRLENQVLQLREECRNLKDMNRAQSRFFANISHELRTHLTLIMTPLHQMFSRSRHREQKIKLGGMFRNSQHTLTLINQLSDLSSYDSNGLSLHAARQNIVPFVESILKAFRLRASKKKLSLEFHVEKEEILLFYDRWKMKGVIMNLLINAIKFTPSGGAITISVSVTREESEYPGGTSKERSESGYVNISVRDTGIGIPAGQLSHIFNRSYQVRNNLGECFPSRRLGTGLVLTKEIVRLHHGVIDVHSTDGKGTEFYIRLPLGNKHLTPEEIVDSPAMSEFQKSDIFELLDMDLNIEEEVGEEETYKARKERRKSNVILVIENNDEVRACIRESLQARFEIAEAKDGKEGIEKAKDISPDVIISEILIPSVDGIQLCRTLKKDFKTKYIPIVFLSAKTSDESIIQGLKAGAIDYITKPFNHQILLSRINNFIELRQQINLEIQREKMQTPSQANVTSEDEKFLKEFQAILEENFYDPDFSADSISRKLIMGRSSLYRKLKALTGETPNHFILSYRLKRAAQLLRESNMSVLQVAFEVGFNSARYFSKCFKARFRQSPLSYKKSKSS